MASKIYDPWGKKSRAMNRFENKFIRMSAKKLSRAKAPQGCMVVVILLSASIFSIVLFY